MVTDTGLKFRSQVQVIDHFILKIHKPGSDKDLLQVDNFLKEQGIETQVWLRPGGISKSGRRSPLQGKTPKKIPKEKLKRRESTKVSEKERKEYAYYFKEGENIDSLVESCVEEQDGGWSCKACGVKKSVKSNLQNLSLIHISEPTRPY